MTGFTSMPRVFVDLDIKVAEHDSMRADFARAVGFYDCPCGSAYVFLGNVTLEDYAALNRWLGEHSAADHGPNIDDSDAAALAVSASAAAVMGMPAVVGTNELSGLLAELAAMAKREHRLIRDAAQLRRQLEAMTDLLEKAHMRADAAEDAIGYEKQRREEAEAALAEIDEALTQLRNKLGDR